MIEKAHIFTSRAKQLVAIEHMPKQQSDRGLIIVVGGPQTRVGSHRMFVYLARELAKQGVHVFRFDYTGAGDSEGDIANFTDIQADIGAAITMFSQLQPQIKAFTLWGLCDAASAILIYLKQEQDERIKGLVLVNPWVRQASTQAKAYLTSYYVKRLLTKSFWQKLFNGRVKLTTSAKEIKNFHQLSKHDNNAQTFIDEMQQGLAGFLGNTLILLSGNDLTADEFKLLVNGCAAWQELLNRANVSQISLKGTNHTFVDKSAQQQVIKHSILLSNSTLEC